MEIKGIERGKKKKEEDRREYKGHSIYAELQITKVSNIFQYLLRIWSFTRVFSLEWESSSWFILWKSFLNLFHYKVQSYLADCLPYLSVLVVGIWSNFLVADRVI